MSIFLSLPTTIFTKILSLSSPLVSTVDGQISSLFPTISEGSTQITIILISFIFFILVYLLEAYLQSPFPSKKLRHSWTVLTPSQIHALTVTFLGWTSFLNPDLWSSPQTLSSPSSYLGCCIICGYMLADLISVIFHF
ncbi:hypothetical protein TrST_g11327 [Triparma strigata]|uniref:Uncharacterized protein n=1 Tax=Triparma strigata TaxID=1606541 RepID=A0A9W7EA42_9STRA|nr:hypothetical protein TrST_g11327 [Triparma strigata]